MQDIERQAEQPKIEKGKIEESKTPEEITEAEIESLIKNIKEKEVKEKLSEILSEKPEEFLELYGKVKESFSEKELKGARKALGEIMTIKLGEKEEELQVLTDKFHKLEEEYQDLLNAWTRPFLATKWTPPTIEELKEIEKAMASQKSKLKEAEAELDKLKKTKEKLEKYAK